MSEKINEVPPDGILLIDKQKGGTSFDSVRVVKRILKSKKIGHAGTLDPFATGLLILLLGQGTKLSHYIMGGIKKYRAEIRLGIETDTYDSTGTILKEMALPEYSTERIIEEVSGFKGVIEQVPPAYSALKVNGERAYKLARKGMDVELEKREVTVYSIDIIDIRLPLLIIDVTCSAGTYVRSLAVDLGRKLDTVAHLQGLRRISSGLFNVNDALVLKGPDFLDREGILERVIPMDRSLPEMARVCIDGNLARRVRNGYRPLWNELDIDMKLFHTESGCIKLLAGADLVAVMEIDASLIEQGKWLKKIRVFN